MKPILQARISLLFFLLICCCEQFTYAQQGKNSLNPDLEFYGDHIVYKGKTIQLGPKAFYIDGQLTAKEASKYKFVFTSINDAAKHLTDGTEAAPMVLYIAPYVYWIDDPDDPSIRVPKSGGIPFGLEIRCQWLRFYGLDDDAHNVVTASNRGQTMGAKGNFTMLRISGQGTSAENITFGNYCNIDLVYPLKPELGRKKRGSAIVQAQLIFCNGDKIFARNCRFVSRLNLCPFIGGKRTLFDHCHFECTDDALNGTAVYLGCTFDFYSSKPFYRTIGTGAVFLNCDIRSFTRGNQYFTKAGGQVAVVDTRLSSKTASYLGWKDIPSKTMPDYQFQVDMNQKPVFIGKNDPYSTVDMKGKPVLSAYRFLYNGKVVYNTYNLLRGYDDWDPMGIKGMVLRAAKESGKPLINLPTQLLVSPSRDSIETGKDTVVLKAKVYRFGNYALNGEKVTWRLAPPYQSLPTLEINNDGTCLVIPTNSGNQAKEVIVRAVSPSGLEGASDIFVSPPLLDAPKFSSPPEMINNHKGRLAVHYGLDTRFKDETVIDWYRCVDNKGADPIQVEVSRFNEPKRDYSLSRGDVGYYIMAKIFPKDIRSMPGKEVDVITTRPVSTNEVKTRDKVWRVDLRSMSTKYQPEVKPGFWTLDCFAPPDTHDWVADNSHDPWYYGKGINGASNDSGLVQANKGARLRYTPVGNDFGDMKITFMAVPAKTAGQGFSSARQQYMDVFIKFDTRTLTGYALRLIRTTKYSDAIDFILMKYQNGLAVPISKPVSASCYRPDCFISLEIKNDRFIVDATTNAKYYMVPGRPEVKEKVHLESPVSGNRFGGFGFQHTGTVAGGATLIKDLKVIWA